MMWERGPKCKRTFLELGDTPTPRNKFIKIQPSFIPSKSLQISNILGFCLLSFCFTH